MTSTGQFTHSDLDGQLQTMITDATANPKVADALAAFEAANQHLPSPLATSYAPVRYSNSGNF